LLIPAPLYAKPTVWVVDDSALEASAICHALAGAFDCEVFCAGSAVLERLALAGPPHVLVLDWELPDMSGVEVCRFIRTSRDELSLPIVLVTGRRDDADVVDGLAAGANDFLTKPYMPTVLLARVKSLARTQWLHRRSIEAEAQLATTLRSIGDAVISTDAEGRVRFLNAVAAELTGWTHAEALGRPLVEVFRLLHAATRAPVASPVDHVLRDGKVAWLPNHALLIRRDGRELPIDDSAAPIRDEAGVLTGVVLVFRDITETQRADAEREALLARTAAAQADAEAEREKLQRVVEASGAGLWDLEVATGAIDADPRMVALMGLPEGASLTLASALVELLPEDRGRVADAVAAALAGVNGGRYSTEFRTGGRHGAPLRWVESRASVQFDGAGNAVRLRGAMIDVTARKLAELEREALLDALATQSLLLVGVLRGPALVYQMANAAYLRSVGGRSVVGKPLLEALPEAAGRAAASLIHRVIETGIPYVNPETTAYLDERGDGVLVKKHFNLVYQPVRGDTGAFDGVLIIAQDITAAVRAREELQATKARLQEVFQLAPAVVALLEGPDHRFTLANPYFRDLVGGRDLVGKPIAAALPELAAQGFIAVLDEVRRTDRPHTATETWISLVRDGGGAADEMCINFAFQPVRGADGQVDGVFVHAVDVTELVRARLAAQRLATEREAAYHVLERGDTVFIVDAAWRLTFANAAFERFTARRREDVLGQVLWDAFPGMADPAIRYFETYQRAMRDRLPVDLTEYFPELDVWTAVRAYPTAEGGLAIFVRDVTAEKQAEVETKSRAEFERQLIGIVSHDLRNPLSTILLGTQLLMSFDGVDERMLKALVRMQSSAQRGARMVSDLLDFTQARVGGGIAVVVAPGNLHTVVRQVVDDATTTAPGREAEVTTSGDGEGVWDLDRMSQVLTNLIGNALKYSPASSVVSVRSEADTHGVTVSVHNRGAPIAPDALARIFQPMQRATAQLENKARSVGLGLFIVKHLVEAHHGRIAVESTADTGTTFSLWVPRQPPAG
jgi:PAS domain S-box-containing protein